MKYNEEFELISYGDRYDKLDEEICVLVHPNGDKKLIFKASGNKEETSQQKEWKLIDGKEDGLSEFLGKPSRTVDVFIPEPMTYSIGTIASWISEKALVEPDNIAEQTKNNDAPQTIPNRALKERVEPELTM